MNVETANKLVQLRKKNGLSQEELAEKIGVSRQAVSKWERAESSPDTDNLIALSKIYNLSLDEMIGGEQKDGYSYNPNDVDVDEDDDARSSRNKMLKRIPIPAVVTLIYLILGFVWDLWHPGWLIYLTVPIWYAIVGNKE